MKIIPAIDIINGQCVRLTQGDYKQKKVYDEHPLDVAKELEDKGFKYLHLVDLDGAKSSNPKNLYILNQVAIETDLKIDFGGGIKSEDTLIQSLCSGAHQVNIGSLSVRNPNLVKFWILRYGADKIIIGGDVKDKKMAISGWTEKTELQIFDFINDFSDNGAVNFVVTDIAKDGMMKGTSIGLYREIIQHFPDVQLTASGGVSSMQEIADLQELGCSGVILGKALYEGLLDPIEVVKEFQ